MTARATSPLPLGTRPPGFARRGTGWRAPLGAFGRDVRAEELCARAFGELGYGEVVVDAKQHRDAGAYAPGISGIEGTIGRAGRGAQDRRDHIDAGIGTGGRAP